MFAREGDSWEKALASWTCPTRPDNSQEECDPCGYKDSWGNWDHIACRGDSQPDKPWAYRNKGNGYVTNVHITDYKTTGTLPIEELCPLSNLRELDLDGGRLEGNIPTNFAECFPELLELDLSYNQFSGAIPPEIANIPKLKQFKVEVNSMEGEVPEEIGNIPNLEWLRLATNKLSGRIPANLARTSDKLYQLTMDENNFEGDLYMLKDHDFVNFFANDNPKLCGMVPIGLQFAHGFNYHNTRLGLPCPEELENGM